MNMYDTFIQCYIDFYYEHIYIFYFILKYSITSKSIFYIHHCKHIYIAEGIYMFYKYISLWNRTIYSTFLSKAQVVKEANKIKKSQMKKKHVFRKTLHKHAHAISHLLPQLSLSSIVFRHFNLFF